VITRQGAIRREGEIKQHPDSLFAAGLPCHPL
jgi:hypothetical protein